MKHYRSDGFKNLTQNCMSLIKKGLLAIIAISFFNSSFGQQLPGNPISYRIYTPFIMNPAIAGSKDFLSSDLLAGFQGKTYSQVISGNTRIGRKIPGYISSSGTYKFTRSGIGAAAFSEINEITRTIGASVALSYHFPLNDRKLSFISAGISLKGIYHFYEGHPEININPKEFIYPDADIGVYLYSPVAFAGLSAVNIVGPPEDKDTLQTYIVPVSRQYNLLAGYKIVISRSLNIIVEPSVIVVTDDSLTFDIKENIQPALKLYAGNFCLGTYFNDYSKISFFFQYRYPKFYIGTFFALPKDSPFFKKSPTAEISLGMSLSHNKSGYRTNGHW